MSSQLKNDIDNALQGVLHGLIERHISRDEALERLREIVAGMVPMPIVDLYEREPMFGPSPYWVITVNGVESAAEFKIKTAIKRRDALRVALGIKEGV